MSDLYILHDEGIFLTTYESMITYLTEITTMDRKTAHETLSRRVTSYGVTAKENGALSWQSGCLESILQNGDAVSLPETCKTGNHIVESSLRFKMTNCFIVNPVFQFEVEAFHNSKDRFDRENV